MLTVGQDAVVRFVRDHTIRIGYPPTFRDVAKALGVSLATVRQRIRALEQAGLLEHDVGVYRSLRTKERRDFHVDLRTVLRHNLA